MGGLGSYDWGKGGRGGTESSSWGLYRAGSKVTHGATLWDQGNSHLVQSSPGPQDQTEQLICHRGISICCYRLTDTFLQRPPTIYFVQEQNWPFEP